MVSRANWPWPTSRNVPGTRFCGIRRLVGLRGISRVRNPPLPEQHDPITVPCVVGSPGQVSRTTTALVRGFAGSCCSWQGQSGASLPAGRLRWWAAESPMLRTCGAFPLRMLNSMLTRRPLGIRAVGECSELAPGEQVRFVRSARRVAAQNVESGCLLWPTQAAAAPRRPSSSTSERTTTSGCRNVFGCPRRAAPANSSPSWPPNGSPGGGTTSAPSAMDPSRRSVRSTRASCRSPL